MSYLKLSNGDVLYAKPVYVSASKLVEVDNEFGDELELEEIEQRAGDFHPKAICYVAGFNVSFSAGGSQAIAWYPGMHPDRALELTEKLRKEVTDWCESEVAP